MGKIKNVLLGACIGLMMLPGTVYAGISDHSELYKSSEDTYASRKSYSSFAELLEQYNLFIKENFKNSSIGNFNYLNYDDGSYYRFEISKDEYERFEEENVYNQKWLEDNMPVIVPEGTDGIQALDLIYQWIINNTEYELNHPASDWAYTALKGENVSCIGYANLFDIMTEYVPFNVETGLSDYSGNSECWHFDTKIIVDDEHGWNGIDINGTWYYFDVTFDDTGNHGNKYFMKTADEFYNDEIVNTNSGKYVRKNENLDVI